MYLKFYKKRSIALLGLLLLLTGPFHPLIAQSSYTLSGKVRSEAGEPLPGVSILVQGQSKGTVSNIDGQYSLEVNGSETLVFSAIGFLSQPIPINDQNPLDVTLLDDTQQLSEIIVTAVGIKNQTRALGYSVSEVKGRELLESREPNVVAALSGRIAGVQINSSGGSPGGSSTIRIRGNSSLLGNNFPLFILDGIPIDNSIQDILPISNAVSLATPSNRAVDINNADIESITVLKGPAAAALYGIRAANGAVIITTKRGNNLTDRPIQVSYSGSVTVDQRNRRLQPRQYEYSNGINGNYIVPGNTGADENWGAPLSSLTYSSVESPFDRNGLIVDRDSPLSNGIPVNRYDNIGNFLVNGVSQDHNVSVYGNTGKAGYYFSYGNLKQTGIIPTTDFYRQTFRFNGDFDVSDKLRLSGGVNYINDGANNRALMGGFNTNVMRALINTPPNFDITNGLDQPWANEESYKLPPTAARPWGASRSYAGGIGWDSPYWSLNMNPQSDELNRFITFVEASYDINPWLKTTARYGLDSYTDVRKGGFSRGTSGVATGTINDVHYSRRDNNIDVLLFSEHTLGTDFTLNVITGYNYYSSYRNQINTRGDGLTIPGNFNISNASSTQTINQTIERKLVAGYADVKLDYRGWWFFEVTGRNEWTSTLARGRNSFFYPSVGTSLVFTDVLNWNSKWLSFGKLRGTYAQVGNDAEPYSLDTYYTTTTASGWIQSGISFPFSGQQGLSYSATIGNPYLRPERITTYEIGAELHFFNRRTVLDGVYYHNSSKDQIIPISLPFSTGARQSLTNAGNIVNRGFEATLQQALVRRPGFSWNATLLFNRNISEVKYITDDITNVSLGGIWMEARGQAGEPYGVFYGLDVTRNEDGQVIIDDNASSPNYGYPVVNTEFTRIGDPNPDFNLGLRNEFRAGAFTFSFLFDGRFGFDIFNAPRLQMVYNGVDESTLARGTRTVFEGVTAEGQPNNIEVELNQNWYRKTFNIQGLYVEKDLYWLKLKDVNITYDLPKRVLDALKVTQASVTLTGRNFLLSTNYTGSDPDLGTRNGLVNFSGIDFWTTPNTHSIGGAINITF